MTDSSIVNFILSVYCLVVHYSVGKECDVCRAKLFGILQNVSFFERKHFADVSLEYSSQNGNVRISNMSRAIRQVSCKKFHKAKRKKN